MERTVLTPRAKAALRKVAAKAFAAALNMWPGTVKVMESIKFGGVEIQCEDGAFIRMSIIGEEDLGPINLLDQAAILLSATAEASQESERGARTVDFAVLECDKVRFWQDGKELDTKEALERLSDAVMHAVHQAASEVLEAGNS